MTLPLQPGRIVRRRPQGGWTLVELMVVLVIVGILASSGLGFFQGHILNANVGQATPYLQAIAAKNRLHFNRTGRYLASANEEEIQKKLGIDLSDAGDFCFMIFCTSATSCGSYGSSPYSGSTPASATVGTLVTVPGSQGTAFQVVAVLRRKSTTGTTTGSVSGAGTSCTPSYTNAPIKLEPSGWVAASGTKGGEGRVVILSYPPPPDGESTSTSVAGHSVTLRWNQGITLSDAVSN